MPPLLAGEFAGDKIKVIQFIQNARGQLHCRSDQASTDGMGG